MIGENNESISKIDMSGVPDDLVFGLDIGTRSIVGTVGYKADDGKFMIVAQTSRQHKTRSMLDGQIHDIGKVSETISSVHNELEEITGRKFTDVCIAAAGRVLKTIEEEAEMTFPEEMVVTNDNVYSLDMLAVEKAHSKLKEEEGESV